MNISTGLLLLIIGLLAGGYGSIVGAGGGFIFVPALLLLFKISPTIAAGTGLVIVLINSLSGVVGYARQNRIHYRTGVILSIGAFPGALLGVWVLEIYSSTYFYIIFGSILTILGIFLILKNTGFKKTKVIDNQYQKNSINEVAATTSSLMENNKYILERSETKNIQVRWLIPIGFFMGILSSYLGIGGGWLLVPLLIYFFRVPTHNATATSIFSLCLYSSVGVILQIWNNNIDWLIVLMGGIGIIIGSQLGVFLSQKIPSRIIMQMLSILLIAIGIRMYFH
ncbi:sulfite exporter TauE/SafE family protein [Bacillus sp. JJ1521]|uniref:sulfite exporter TauE/SafE family protein n=1 Tax=Bacillus sp. JJ1521 TaxID=3122957 RepID=UPI002FFF179C